MIIDRKPFTLDRLVRLGMTALLICGVIWLLGYLSDVLIPFAAALLLAYLVNPLVMVIQKKLRNRVAAVLVSLTLVLLALVMLAAIMIPLLTREMKRMGRVVSQLVTESELFDKPTETGEEKSGASKAPEPENDPAAAPDQAAAGEPAESLSLMQKAEKNLPPWAWKLLQGVVRNKQVQAFFESPDFISAVQSVAKKVLPGVWSVIGGVLSLLAGLVGLITVALYLVFVLIDYDEVRKGWKDLLPHQWRDPIVEFVADFNTAMNRHFRAQAIVAAIVGILFAIGFGLIGLPMGILLGLFIGLLNMVPYLQIVGLIPAAMLALVHHIETDASLGWTLFWIVAVFIVVQTIQDAFLTPRIMGKVTGLSPAMILLSLSIWGKLLGMLGLLIALPMTCLILAYYRRLLAADKAAAAAAEAEETASG